MHLFITCPKNSNGNDEKGDFHLFSMVSNLFDMELKASSPGNTTSAQGIQDAFLVARHFANRGNVTRKESSDQSLETVAPVVSILPPWFPWDGRSEDAMDFQSSTQAPIVNRYEVINVLTRCTVKKISDVYATFFTKLWSNAFQQHLVPKQISYCALTPPWLREQIVFMHGTSGNVSIPFSRRSLHTKHQVRESGQKALACTIMDTWIRRESESATELLGVLSHTGIQLPIEILSGRRNGLNEDENRDESCDEINGFNE